MPKERDDRVLEDWRAQKLADWIHDTGRKVGWVAMKLGRSKVWISYVLNGHFPVSESLARDIELELGLDMGIGTTESDAPKV